MRIIGVGVGILIVMDFFATLAFGQVADPAKSGTTPWTVDPRCAVMGAHMYNQGSLTSSCLAARSGVPYINQTPGYHQSQTQSQHSVLPQRQRVTPPTDSRE